MKVGQKTLEGGRKIYECGRKHMKVDEKHSNPPPLQAHLQTYSGEGSRRLTS